jgi:hypothetical protein
MPAFASGGVVSDSSMSSVPRAMGGGVNVNVSMGLLDAPSSSVQRRRLLLSLASELDSLVKDGVMLRGVPRLRTV